MSAVTLTEFLLARIAEDEEAARAATPSMWTVRHNRHDFRDGSFCEAWGVEGADGEDVVEIALDRDYYTPEGACARVEDAEHIARHDPARVLTECEAKRRIVARLTDERGGSYGPDETADLQDLASVYADHPDYNPTWAV